MATAWTSAETYEEDWEWSWEQFFSIRSSTVTVSLAGEHVDDKNLEELLVKLHEYLTAEKKQRGIKHNKDLITNIDLSRNRSVTDDGVKHLVQFLNKWPACRRLKLYDTSIGDASLIALSGWAAKGHAHEIHLSDLHGKVTAKGVEHMLSKVCQEGKCKYPYQLDSGSRSPLWLRLEHNGIQNTEQLEQRCLAKGMEIEVIHRSELGTIRPGGTGKRAPWYGNESWWKNGVAAVQLVMFHTQQVRRSNASKSFEVPVEAAPAARESARTPAKEAKGKAAKKMKNEEKAQFSSGSNSKSWQPKVQNPPELQQQQQPELPGETLEPEKTLEPQTLQDSQQVQKPPEVQQQQQLDEPAETSEPHTLPESQQVQAPPEVQQPQHFDEPAETSEPHTLQESQQVQSPPQLQQLQQPKEPAETSEPQKQQESQQVQNPSDLHQPQQPEEPPESPEPQTMQESQLELQQPQQPEEPAKKSEPQKRQEAQQVQSPPEVQQPQQPEERAETPEPHTLQETQQVQTPPEKQQPQQPEEPSEAPDSRALQETQQVQSPPELQQPQQPEELAESSEPQKQQESQQLQNPPELQQQKPEERGEMPDPQKQQESQPPQPQPQQKHSWKDKDAPEFVLGQVGHYRNKSRQEKDNPNVPDWAKDIEAEPPENDEDIVLVWFRYVIQSQDPIQAVQRIQAVTWAMQDQGADEAETPVYGDVLDGRLRRLMVLLQWDEATVAAALDPDGSLFPASAYMDSAMRLTYEPSQEEEAAADATGYAGASYASWAASSAMGAWRAGADGQAPYGPVMYGIPAGHWIGHDYVMPFPVMDSGATGSHMPPPPPHAPPMIPQRPGAVPKSRSPPPGIWADGLFSEAIAVAATASAVKKKGSKKPTRNTPPQVRGPPAASGEQVRGPPAASGEQLVGSFATEWQKLQQRGGGAKVRNPLAKQAPDPSQLPGSKFMS